MFFIGQKIVCIRDIIASAGETVPHVGIIYTVRSFAPSNITLVEEDTPLIRLNEIHNHPRYYIGIYPAVECGFPVRCFRPLVDKPADISIFYKILDEVKVKARKPERV